MDVANEASAPDPEPTTATTPEAIPVTPPEAIPVAPPEAVPVAPPATPPSATDLEDAALAFQPSRFRTVVTQPFWAGMLGGGVGLWLGCWLQALAQAYLIERPEIGLGFFLPLFAALGVALFRGYRSPVQSYPALVGRTLGALFFGAICAGVTGGILGTIFDGLRFRGASAAAVLAFAGAVLAGLALARLYGIGPDQSRRIKIGSAAAVVLLVTIWPAAPSLRCRLGFGEGCREAYASQDDHRSAGLVAQRGCEHGNAVSCRLAGQTYQQEGPPRDLRRAEDFFREGCALGDPESCDAVHELELLQRCDRYGAFACAELARAHASGDGMKRDRALAQRYYRKACLLGADDACREAEGR